jgi:hypothetical protein
MPLTFTPISNSLDWSGSSWVVANDDELATLVARVALGQEHYARRILKETGFTGALAKTTALAGAVRLLTAVDPVEPWHRDGWLFQVISWIAAHIQDPKALIAPPHMIHAHKGFDGIHVRVDAKTNQVASVVICEEKATNNARKMVRDRIWTEFKEMQRGDRDNELVAEATRLLRSQENLDVDKAIEAIIWENQRAYRIAVTISDEHNHAPGHAKLFKGYDVVIAGDTDRRRGEVFFLTDLRNWMDMMAKKAIAKATALVVAHV